MKYKRIITIVMDSVGIGEAPDAARFDDVGADTLGHIATTVGGLHCPNLQKLGLGNIAPLEGIRPTTVKKGYYTKMAEASNGKDTMTGHWELMGLHIEHPFVTFTETGFPDELIKELERKTGHQVIGNKAASGTEIIEELGEEHIRTGAMIVYTSSDSVLQIAANEETFGLQELYRCCEIARELTMSNEWKVGRVIARPFIGTHKGAFTRTSNRHDYALSPFAPTALDSLKEAGLDVISVGKIADIFNNQGITESNRTKNNADGMEKTTKIIKEKSFQGLLFVNLVDFDALWGHRRNTVGYAKELEAFDQQLGVLLPNLRNDDLLVITADHGNDPTFKGTDHTREFVPILYYSPSMVASGPLSVASTYADLAATILDNFKSFNVRQVEHGYSVLKQLI